MERWCAALHQLFELVTSAGWHGQSANAANANLFMCPARSPGSSIDSQRVNNHADNIISTFLMAVRWSRQKYKFSSKKKNYFWSIPATHAVRLTGMCFSAVFVCGIFQTFPFNSAGGRSRARGPFKKEIMPTTLSNSRGILCNSIRSILYTILGNFTT